MVDLTRGRFSRRLAKRGAYNLPVNFRIPEETGTFVGELHNVSQSGALLATDKPLPNNARVTLQSASRSPIFLEPVQAEVVREGGGADDSFKHVYALAFHDLPHEADEALKCAVQMATGAKGRPLPIIKYSVMGGLFVGLPAILFSGNWLQPGFKNLLISIVIMTLAIERTIETFLTVRRKGTMGATEDWSISAVSFYYVCMTLLASTETLWLRPKLWAPATMVGCVLLAVSFTLRWWSMKTLGNLWEIQLVGDRQWAIQTQKIALIRNGPYRFMRHPIYAGLIIELVGIPLVLNAFWTLIFVGLVNIPLQVLRTRLEEKQLIQVLGGQYAVYANECLAFFPWHRSIKRMEQDRRTRDIVVDFADRRIGGIKEWQQMKATQRQLR
jgi:protein-S-isoprenylcysteine O-methyltransferase Ste14